MSNYLVKACEQTLQKLAAPANHDADFAVHFEVTFPLLHDRIFSDLLARAGGCTAGKNCKRNDHPYDR